LKVDCGLGIADHEIVGLGAGLEPVAAWSDDFVARSCDLIDDCSTSA